MWVGVRRRIRRRMVSSGRRWQSDLRQFGWGRRNWNRAATGLGIGERWRFPAAPSPCRSNWDGDGALLSGGVLLQSCQHPGARLPEFPVFRQGEFRVPGVNGFGDFPFPFQHGEVVRAAGAERLVPS